MVAEPEASVVDPEVVSVVDLEGVDPEVVSVVDLEDVDPDIVSVSEPQASVDIPVVFVVLVPVSVVAVEGDSPGRPKFLAFPNVDHFASPSSSVELVG